MKSLLNKLMMKRLERTEKGKLLKKRSVRRNRRKRPLKHIHRVTRAIQTLLKKQMMINLKVILRSLKVSLRSLKVILRSLRLRVIKKPGDKPEGEKESKEKAKPDGEEESSENSRRSSKG